MDNINLKAGVKMEPHMKGREIEPEKLQDIVDKNNVSGIIDQKPDIVNEPTTQDGYNEDGTIKEIKVEDTIVDYGDFPSNSLMKLAKDELIKNQKK